MPTVELRRQVVLSGYNTAIAVPYPKYWRKPKSVDEDDRYFSVSPQPGILTLDEIEYAREYIKTTMKLPEATIEYTGAVLGPPDDPLYQFSHKQLNALEKECGFPNSEFAPSRGQRSIQERVLLIREADYTGDGSEFSAPEEEPESPDPESKQEEPEQPPSPQDTKPAPTPPASQPIVRRASLPTAIAPAPTPTPTSTSTPESA